MGRGRAGLVFGVWMVFVLFVAVFGVVLNVPLVWGSGTIYIRADGSIEPSTAPIQRDGNLYAFTDNIYDSIVVERDNIVVDGAGHTLQGAAGGTGIDLSDRKNVTIKNMEIKRFYYGIKLVNSLNNNISGNNMGINYISGIELWGSSSNGISRNNIIELHSFGIKLDESSNNNTISGNHITKNGWGIKLSGSNYNTISGNKITANEQNGIELFVSSNNTISGNNITNNQQLGIMLSGSSNSNSIKGNNITGNGYGVRLHSSLKNTVSGNNLTNHLYGYGIKLEYSSNYTITGNNIANNSWGIEFEYSSNYNRIYTNNITNNDYGIWLMNSSSNSIFHNNFVNNAVQKVTTIPYLVNAWDDGYPSGGNYWSDYTIKYPDAKKLDGIWDTPYVIDADNRDRYPLVNPWTPKPSEAYISVPYHSQIKSYYCGPAALEMVFDFYGLDIPQLEIADVARTAPDGTYTSDMTRATHFSNLSTSVGREMPVNITGYTTRQLGYAAFEYGGMTIDQLRSLIAAGYPIIVLTTWHYRVAVGYNSTHITFQDSYYGSMYNMTIEAFDADWDYSGHWALFISPWKIEVSTPQNALEGSVFNVTANITYPSHPPFPTNQYPASMVNATVTLPVGLTLMSGETAKKSVTGDLPVGTSTNVTWSVRADNPRTFTISVEAEGKVTGLVPPLPSYPQSYSYEDRIGGFSEAVTTVTSDEIPPTTTIDDYDDSWHTTDFIITLTASNDLSGVAETYYRINDGPIQNVSSHGHPLITAERTNNTLEYWSVDLADNEELPHKILTSIKLDKNAPTGSIVIDNGNAYTTSGSVTLTLTATDLTSGVHQVRFSGDNVWDNEPWETPTQTKTWMLSSQDGTKTVYYQIKDNAGLISQSYSDDIILDATSPTITISSPSLGYEIRSSTVTATWTGSDQTSGISHYEIRLDDGSWTNIGTNTEYTFTELSEGTHTIDVKAVDKAGNTQQDTVNFKINTYTPPPSPPLTVIAASVAIITIALAAIVYFVKRKH